MAPACAFHDLNVCVSFERREEALRELHKLGYSVVAFTTVFRDPSELTAERCPAVKSRIWAAPSGSASHSNVIKRPRTMTVLERAHLVISQASHMVLFQSNLLSKFDLISVQPATEKLLQNCFQFDFDILSLDLAARKLFIIKATHISVCMEKGVHFEISYNALLNNRDDRKQVISNTCMLGKRTFAKNIIVSSGTNRLIEFRGAYDAANLATIFGIPYERARETVTLNARSVVQHGDIRCNTTKGIVRIVGKAQKSKEDDDAMEDVDV